MTTEYGYGSGYRGSHLLTAFILGAAAGAVIAYYMAPEESRRKVREAARDAARNLGQKAREMGPKVKESLNRGYEAARSVMEEATDTDSSTSTYGSRTRPSGSHS